jgi:tripartite-type tricarboxylate transporter receptor subunit TctC
MDRRTLLQLMPTLLPVCAARANDYPRQPISIVTPLAAGDAADHAARLMGQELSGLLGAAVTVVNRPGSGGSLGTQSVIRAPKDGYTILFAQNSPLTIRRVLEPETANYDPLKDLIPLGLTTRSPSVLVVQKDGPIKSFKEMIVSGQKNTKGTLIGNAGPGSVGEISIQLMNAQSGSTLTSVNYKGAGPAITDLLGGHIDGAILALGALSAHLRSGALRALTISSPNAEFSSISTLRQMGYKYDLLGIWFAFFAPVGVASSTVEVLVQALEKITKNSNISSQLHPIGITQEWGSPRTLSEEISNEYRIIKELMGNTPKNNT